jgi:hypothetical protein
MPLSFVSNIFDIPVAPALRSDSSLLVRAFLPIDPLTYIGRTIPEFGSLGFAEGKESHRFLIDKKDVLEIDRHSALFLCEQVSQRLDLLAFKPTTDAQDRQTFFTDESFDSPIRCVVLVQAVRR